jgi:hypothetical protein
MWMPKILIQGARFNVNTMQYKLNWNLWPESTRELYRPSDRRMSAKLVPTSADRGRHVVSVTDPFGRIIGFLDRNRCFFLQVPPQLYSRG